MLRLKSCPKCKNGDVTLDRDYYGWYEYCLQCGYMRDLVDMDEPGQQQSGSIRDRRERVRISCKGK